MESTIHCNNQDITPNTWLLNIVRALKLTLDGHHVDITVRREMAKDEMFTLKTAILYLLESIEDYDLYGVTINPHPSCNMGDPDTDLIMIKIVRSG